MSVEVSVFLLDLECYAELVESLVAYRDRGDTSPLRSQIKLALSNAKASRKATPGAVSTRIYDTDLRLLEGADPKTAGENRRHIETTIAPSLLLCNCVPIVHGKLAIESASDPVLMPYLYARSVWIDEVFTFGVEIGGRVLPIQYGEWNRQFLPTEIRKLYAELLKIQPPPDKAAAARLKRLLDLARTANEDSRYGLVMGIW